MEVNGRPDEERLAAFLREHPKGRVVIVAGSEHAFREETRDDERIRIVTKNTTGSDTVDHASCLVICGGYAAHEPARRLKERARQGKIPVFYVPTTRAFERAVELAKEQPTQAPEPAAPAKAPSLPLEPQGTAKPEPRTVVDLTEGERTSFLIDLAHFFEERGNTATKYELAEFLQNYAILLIPPASRLWLQNHNFIEVAGTGKGGKAGRWKPGPALVSFLKKIGEAPAAPMVTPPCTALEEYEALEEKRKEVRQRALAELEAQIGELGEQIKQLETRRAALTAKKENLMR